MKKSTLVICLKAILLLAGAGGLAVFLWAVPELGQMIVFRYPEWAHCYYPWLILLWLCGVPCYIAMAFAWKIIASLNDAPFTVQNAGRLRKICLLAAGDALFFLVMNVVYLLCGLSHPSVALCSLALTFLGVAISVVCAGLSQLTARAAALQEQSDWTI